MANHFYDKIAGLRFTLSPNGIIDEPPTWTIDSDTIPIIPEADGMSAFVPSPDHDVQITVAVTAKVDNPATPDEVETIMASLTETFSHSKATELGLTVAEVPL